MSIEMICKRLKALGYIHISWQIVNNELSDMTVRYQGEVQILDIDQIVSLVGTV